MNFGDVIEVDFGTPRGSEAGFTRPAIVRTADAFLRFRPTTIIVAHQITDIIAMVVGIAERSPLRRPTRVDVRV